MKILVIRFKHIGDVLLSSVICSSLRESFPEAQIAFLMHGNSAALFEGHPAINNVLTIEPEDKGPVPFFRRIWGITRERYDIIIDATSTGRSELISALSPSSKIRIGRKKRGRGYFYTHSVPKGFVNKLDQRLAMLQPLIDEGYPVTPDREIRLFLTDAESRAAREKVVASGLNPDRFTIAFSVSSKLDYRYWDLDYMAEVVGHCLQMDDVQIILIPGMPHEQALISQFRNRFPVDAPINDKISANGLRALFGVLDQCDLYIGNEGGPRHFAEALGLPTVCVVSPSVEREEWMPNEGSRHRAIAWRDLFEGEEEPSFEFGDQTYNDLYRSIKPAHLIKLVDEVMAELGRP